MCYQIAELLISISAVLTLKLSHTITDAPGRCYQLYCLDLEGAHWALENAKPRVLMGKRADSEDGQPMRMGGG